MLEEEIAAIHRMHTVNPLDGTTVVCWCPVCTQFPERTEEAVSTLAVDPAVVGAAFNAEPGWLYIDTSTLKSLAQCSTQVLLRYAHDRATLDEAAPLRAGSAMHRLAETWLRGGTKAEALAAFEGEYKEWATKNVLAGDRLDYVNVWRILDAWLDTHPVNGFPFKVDPTHVEIGFAYPLIDGIAFTGRMDAIVTSHETGDYYIVEHKSTGQLSSTWAEQWFTDPQLSGYIWAARQHLNRPVIGAYVNGIEFGKLPSSDRKCAKHGVPYSECGAMHAESQLLITQRTDDELNRWKKDAIHLAKRFMDLVRRFPSLEQLGKVATQGKWSNSCRWCGFRKFCQIGRPLNLLDSFTITEHWDPLQYAFSGRKESARKP